MFASPPSRMSRYVLSFFYCTNVYLQLRAKKSPFPGCETRCSPQNNLQHQWVFVLTPVFSVIADFFHFLAIEFACLGSRRSSARSAASKAMNGKKETNVVASTDHKVIGSVTRGWQGDTSTPAVVGQARYILTYNCRSIGGVRVPVSRRFWGRFLVDSDGRFWPRIGPESVSTLTTPFSHTS